MKFAGFVTAAILVSASMATPANHAERYVMITHTQGTDRFWPVVEQGGYEAAKSVGAIFEYRFDPLGDVGGMARLIESAGLKGTRQGGAVVSDLHASFIVNRASELDPECDAPRMQALIARYAQPAGIMLMEEWGLPSAVSLVIRFLGDFANAQNATDIVATVDAGLAIAKAHVAAVADAQDPEAVELDAETVLLTEALQHLNFYPDDVASLLEHTPRIHLAVEGMA